MRRRLEYITDLRRLPPPRDGRITNIIISINNITNIMPVVVMAARGAAVTEAPSTASSSRTVNTNTIIINLIITIRE